MNNDIIAAITAGIEAYEGSASFIVTAVKRQIQIVNVACRNPWSKADGKDTVSVL